MTARLSVALVMLATLCAAQIGRQASLYNDFNFILHLGRSGMMDEAILERARFLQRGDVSQLYRDSVNYYMAAELQRLQRPQEARALYMQVSDEPFFYYPARYRSVLIALNDDQTRAASDVLSDIAPSTNPDLNELRTLEAAGVSLLSADNRTFDSIARHVAFSNKLLADEFGHLQDCRRRAQSGKRKSPFVAGALSTVVPGLGKVYAGNNGQGLAAFLTCGLFGAVTVENYVHLGPVHPQTLIFGGVFALFYVGNIWGSALAVKIVRTEKELENKHNILVALRIPVDRFFN